MDVSTVTDSTDWLNTPLPGLAPLESSLRCQVCKEILTTPMITTCSHTFCSLCIRRYLSQEGKCPSCNQPDQEMKLRHNYAVEELVLVWSEKRAEIYKFAKNAALKQEEQDQQDQEPPKKRRRVGGGAVVVQKSGLEERRSTRSQSRRTASQTSAAASQTLPSTQEELMESDAGSEYLDSPIVDTKHFPPANAEPHDGLVACPNCNRRLREAIINAHLDKCLQGLASPPPPPPPQAGRLPGSSPPPQIQTGTIAYTQSKPTGGAAQRLPTINYSLLNETALRKKLRELGIPNQGNKELMRKRHSEWMNIWNANCDSLQPVGKAKLLLELSAWERNLGKDERQRQAGGANRVMEKEFDREGYMKRENDNFSDLIRKARESAQQKKASTAAATTTTTEAEGTTAGPATEFQTPAVDLNAPAAEPMQMMDINGSGQVAPGATETLVPSTPPRPSPQTNGFHVPPPPSSQLQLQPPPHQQPIDLTSPDKRGQDEQYDSSRSEPWVTQIV